MALRLLRDLPGASGFLVTVAARNRVSHNLTPASRCQDHAAWPYASCRTSCGTPRPSQPASRLVTNGRTSLAWEAGCRTTTVFQNYEKEKYFYEAGLTRRAKQAAVFWCCLRRAQGPALQISSCGILTAMQPSETLPLFVLPR